MTNTATVSLIDILEPPKNQWLRQLGRRAAELPVGVRIVRFSEADDDTANESEDSAVPLRKPAKTAQSSQTSQATRAAA